MSSKAASQDSSVELSNANPEWCTLSFSPWRVGVEVDFSSNGQRKTTLADLAKCHTVQTVMLDMHCGSIFDGSFVEYMSKAPLSSLAFPHATELRFRMAVEVLKVMLQPRGELNAKKFVELINRIIPAKTAVRVDLEQRITDNPMLSRKMTEVLRGIFENAQERCLDQPGMMIPIGAVPAMSGMTSLGFSSMCDRNVTGEFVKKNSPTLKSLGFTYFNISDIAAFVGDALGNPVVYPALESLFLGSYNSLMETKPAIRDDVSFFPALRELTFRAEWPAAGYYLFKGNENTLSHLRVLPNVAVVDQLARFGVFNREKFANLKDIDICSHPYGDIPIIPNASIPDSVYRHVEKCENTCLPAPVPPHDLSEIASTAQFTNTTTLFLNDCSLSLGTIVLLLHSLPMLKRVSSYFDGLGSEFAGMSYKQVSNILLERYPQLNNSFTRWNIHNGVSMRLQTLEDLAASAVMLSNLCPLFSSTDARTNQNLWLMDTVEMLTINGML